MHGRRRQRWTNAQRVYLGLVWTADDSGLWTDASNVRIGDASGGLYPVTVARRIRELERAGDVEVYRPATHWISRRVILVADHANFAHARHYLSALRKSRALPGPLPLHDMAGPVADLLLMTSQAWILESTDILG